MKVWRTLAETLYILESASSRCDPCQRIRIRAKQFWVLFKFDDIFCNKWVFLSVSRPLKRIFFHLCKKWVSSLYTLLWYIDRSLVPHIEHVSIIFDGANIVSEVWSKQMRDTFVEGRGLVCTWIPNQFLIDPGACYEKQFMVFGKLCNVSILWTGRVFQNFLGRCERYPHLLQNTFKTFLISHPHGAMTLCLTINVKAMNDTVGPESDVPSALVFGNVPQLQGKGIGAILCFCLAKRSKVAEVGIKKCILKWTDYGWFVRWDFKSSNQHSAHASLKVGSLREEKTRFK